MDIGKARHLFPGNNTGIGFYSYYAYIMPQREADHIFCLKGGPGVGKSTFMKHIGNRMRDKGFDVEYLHCSSDPGSLDGVVFPQIHVALIDGTAPHVVDPKNPGAVDEIINLGEYWNLDGIKNSKADIININGEVGRIFRRAYRYLAAAKKIREDIEAAVEEATDVAGVCREAQTVVETHLAQRKVGGSIGKIRKQFASAITPDGIIHYLDTLTDDTYQVYKIQSVWGAGKNALMGRIVDEAVMRGFDIEVYYDPLEPEESVEHIVIPALGLAFFSENALITLPERRYAAIDLRPNTDMSLLDEDAIAFDETMLKTLLGEAVATLKKAKTAHDVMETYYVPNMDFDRVREKEDEILERILRRVDS